MFSIVDVPGEWNSSARRRSLASSRRRGIPLQKLEHLREGDQAEQPNRPLFLDPRRSSGDDQIRPGPVRVRAVQTLELAATLTNAKPLAFVGWRAVDGLTPHWLRMVTDAETTNRRSWHIEEAVSNSATLEVRAILLQGTRSWGKQDNGEQAENPDEDLRVE